MYQDPVFPDRIPVFVIVLLVLAFLLLTLAAVGAVALAVMDLSDVPSARGLGFDLQIPDDRVGQVVWFQAALAILTMFLVWLFSILIVAAYAQGSHRNAAATAQVFLRLTIVIMLVRMLAGAVIPYVLSDSVWASVAQLATGLPFLLAEIALLIAADCFFGAVNRNAAS